MFPDTDAGTRGDHQHLTLVTRWFEQLDAGGGQAAK
jgi:hypothetical protein